MLSPLDADLVRRDPALPGLATALDPQALIHALSLSLPEAKRDVSEAAITYVKYKPGTNCLVGYRLEVAGQAVDLYVKAYGANAARKLQKARQQPGHSGALGRGRIPLDDHQIVISVFPNDVKVTALPHLADEETRYRLLRDILPDHPSLWAGAAHRLVYKPERRYVARLQAEDGSQAALKLYTQPGYQLAQRHRALGKPRAPLRLASRLGESDRHAALAFEWLNGQLLSEAIRDPQFNVRSVTTVGGALAQLHAQPPGELPRLTRESEAEALLSEATILGLVCPYLAEQSEALARQIAARLVTQPPAYRLTHGDFHARQVLLNGDTAAILDLDRAVCADPMIDLGLFAAHLEREVIRGNLPASRMEPLMQAIIEGYASASLRPNPEEIRFYTALELFRLAPRFFRYREPEWSERIEASLNRVRNLLAVVAVM